MKLAACLLLFVCQVALAGDLPDPKLTPGVARDVTLNTLCTTSTSTVRNVPESEKMGVYREYGMTAVRTGYCHNPNASKPSDDGCEVDHLISLELGGANDTGNLWPQPYFGACNAHQKDELENKLHKLVCNGTLTIQQAQSSISTDWEAAYSKYVDPKGCK